MKSDIQNLILKCVREILNQYISQLKAHQKQAAIIFKNGYQWEDNVIKCGKGIEYAKNIKNNLDVVVFSKDDWTKKDLIKEFHNMGEKGRANLRIRTSNPRQIAKNIQETLESMGIRTWELFPSILGYCLDRAERELLGNDEKSEPYRGDFGKLGVNYGKTKDFDILRGTDHLQFNVDMEKFYQIVKSHLDSRYMGYGYQNLNKVGLMQYTMGEFIDNFYYGPGLYTNTTSPCHKYQKKFSDFYKKTLPQPKIPELFEEDLAM